MGTSQLARVLGDGSLLFFSLPLEEGRPMVIGEHGPEERFGWGVRLERVDGEWGIAGINDVGDRTPIDWIRIGDPPAQ